MMTKGEIRTLAMIRGPHAGSGCACNQCRQAEALALVVIENERLRDAVLLARFTDREIKEILDDAEEDCAGRVAAENVLAELHAALKEALRMAHPSTAASYTDGSRRAKCEELSKLLSSTPKPKSSAARLANLMNALAEHIAEVADQEILDDATAAGFDVKLEASRVRSALADAILKVKMSACEEARLR